MTFVVFEAGSRCGTSARVFFRDYITRSGEDHVLLLVDADKHFVESALNDMSDDEYVLSEAMFRKKYAVDKVDGEFFIYPADELTRQKGVNVGINTFNRVEPWFYDKAYVNSMLASKGISVPITMDVNNVIIKPNKLSAGSKGISTFSNVCVSERIDIAHEYVVDMFNWGNVSEYYPREVILKNGYDEYIKFLKRDHKVVGFAKSIAVACPEIFTGVSHVQIMEDKDGVLYYIEGSRRQSGTSLVELLVGYNPVELMMTMKTRPYESDTIVFNTWYKYDYLRYIV